MDNFRISYVFKFSEKPAKTYALEFHPETMELISHDPAPAPDWTQLGFNQCKGCPLEGKSSPHCPIARNLSGVAEHFKGAVSYEKTTVFVQTEDRDYFKKTDLQTGLQSLFGLIMATSGCPRMDFLKLMARFHLPFATCDDTMIRTMSLYLLRQYFQGTRGGEADFKLDGLRRHYEDVSMVNQGIIKRLRSLGGGDADRNALVFLDTFAQMLSTEIADFSSLEGLMRISEKSP